MGELDLGWILDFPSKISCNLINPSKSHISKITKKILVKINSIIQSKTSVHQWYPYGLFQGAKVCELVSIIHFKPT